MRFLIISDIHGNIDALEAVLARAPSESYDSLLVLGDLVGLGGNPNEVVDRIFDLKPDVMIRGNHDKVATGIEGADGFTALRPRRHDGLRRRSPRKTGNASRPCPPAHRTPTATSRSATAHPSTRTRTYSTRMRR